MAEQKHPNLDDSLWSTGSWGNVYEKRITWKGAVAINDTIKLAKIPRNFEVRGIELVVEVAGAANSVIDLGYIGDNVANAPDHWFDNQAVAAVGRFNALPKAPYMHDSGKTDEGPVYLHATVKTAALVAGTILHFYVRGVYRGK